MGLLVTIDRAAFTAMGLPGGPLYLHFLRTATKVDALSKSRYLSGGMVNVRTGNLRSSQGPPVVTMVGGRLVAVLENTASYAAAVHNGTRPHVIEGRRSPCKLLKFAGSDGQPVFTHSVNHPGTAARPFLARPLAEVILSGL